MSPTLSWGIMILVGAAIFIALWIWRAKLQYDYLNELADGVVYDKLAVDEWEQPRIVPLGGIHDVEEDSVDVDLVLLQNLLRRDYLVDARWVITEACVLAGHPAKIDKPFEMKRDWEKGCVCGRQVFA